MVANMGLALGEKLRMVIKENVALNSQGDRVLSKVHSTRGLFPQQARKLYGVASLRTDMSKTFQAESSSPLS